MKESNIALITALYNTQHADFYKDIYFPMIKYTMSELVRETNDLSRHYDIEGLQSKIEELFFIKIPVIVLTKALEFLQRNRSDFEVSVYSDKSFKISKIWSEENTIIIEKKTQQISEKYRQLNMLFANYLDRHQFTSSKSLYDFIKGCESEILNYLKTGSKKEEVDQEYYIVIKFIEYIREQNSSLYDIINDIVWGATISGFLQRDNYELGISAVQNVTYYLDTSLIMSLLGFDTKMNVLYAKDLVRLVTNSGSHLKIHPLTLQEVTSILAKVEQDEGPRPGSAIERAFAENDLALSNVLHTRTHLENILSKDYGISKDYVSQSEIDKILQKYRTNQSVLKLSEIWGNSDLDLFREIHDVFLHDYVLKKNGVQSFNEKMSNFFVTLNKDVIALFELDDKIPCTIHASKIILNLWIHNCSCTSVKSDLLTDIISRCMAQQDTDVRRKINYFLKYFKTGDINEQDISIMYSSLMNRSYKTISQVDKFIENENSNEADKAEKSREYIKLIIQFSKEDEAKHNEVDNNARKIQALEERNALLNTKYEELLTSKESVSQSLQELKEKSESQNANLAMELESQKQLVSKLEAEKKQRDIIDGKKNELNKAKEKRSQMRVNQKESVTMIKYWIIVSLESLLIFALIYFVWQFIDEMNESGQFSKESFRNNFKNNWGLVIPALGLIARIGNLYIIEPKVSYNRVRDAQLKSWESRHKEELESVKELIDELNQEIRELSGI